ncbi:uncharacterized protein [Dermacentor albipictus]|uniref:uncharacterized protein isoform X1 n=1 Tax=Dermacentor albipictus TaxID=60249 RepID=UPI0031FCC02E
MLSRAPGTATKDYSDDTEDVEVHAVAVLSTLVSARTLARLAKATANDQDLQSVMRYINGHGDIVGIMKPFASELSLIKGIVFKGSKVVVSKSMRKEVLERIHEGHMGLNKCQARARGLVFWPGLNFDIKNLLQSCEICRKYTYKQQSEPFMIRPAPAHAWYRVGVDIFQYGGSSYLSVFDVHSNFPEVEKLTRTTSSAVIEKLSAIFSRYGIPMEVHTDYGPQFSSYEFALVASRYDFSHVTSSPEFPRSNGLAEKGVQIVKRNLKKTEETKQDFWLGLLNYRSTPLEDGRSLGELLQGRRLRTLLPDFRQQPSVPVFKRAQADTRGRTLPPLNTGDVARVKEKTWNRRAQVTEAVAPRSYRVVTGDNRVLRRNRQHLLPTGELFQQEALECDDRESERACEALQPTAPAATGDSPVSSENIPQAPPPVTTTGPTVSSTAPQALTMRRSTRDRRPPQRLRYDRNFNQVLGIYSPQEGRCIGNDARAMPGAAIHRARLD